MEFLKRKNNYFTTRAEITISTGETVLNFCSNNYLGSSSHEVVQAAKDTLDTHGFGMSSVRFICGTQDIHKTLEKNFRFLWY
jgi:glycine C-acetyltransferase